MINGRKLWLADQREFIDRGPCDGLRTLKAPEPVELAIGKSKFYSHLKQAWFDLWTRSRMDSIRFLANSHDTLSSGTTIQRMSLVVSFLASLTRGLLRSLCLVQFGEHWRWFGLPEELWWFCVEQKEREWIRLEFDLVATGLGDEHKFGVRSIGLPM